MPLALLAMPNSQDPNRESFSFPTQQQTNDFYNTNPDNVVGMQHNPGANGALPAPMAQGGPNRNIGLPSDVSPRAGSAFGNTANAR